MRTINETHRNRLVAEAEEADTVGLTKIAENLTRQVEKLPVREAAEGYTYSRGDFENDIQEILWDVVVRTADFHGSHVDSEKAQGLIDRYAESFVSDLRKMSRLKESGAYEPTLPGESGSEVLSIDEE